MSPSLLLILRVWEEFAAEEKVKLGIGSPVTTRFFSPAAIPHRRLTVVDKRTPAETET